MALSNLLNNQTITIDNHHRGGNVLEWDKRLHIHKRMNIGCKSSVECEIYFADNERGRVFYNERGKNVPEIKNEVLEAFSSSDIRNKFIESFYDAVIPILANNNDRTPSDIIRIIRRAVKRIARSLGLSDDIQDAMINTVQSKHRHMFRTDKYYIGLKDDEVKVSMGDDPQEVFNSLL